MARKYRRLSLAQGAELSIGGLGAGLVAWQLASNEYPISIRILLLLFAWFTLWFFSHDLTHHIMGSLVGIRFRYYFLGRSAIRKLKLPLLPRLMNKIPVLVLKIDSKSMAQATVRARKWMHASGAIVSISLPWIIIPESFSLGTIWGLLFVALVLGNDIFTLYFSPKTGDLFRARMVKD